MPALQLSDAHLEEAKKIIARNIIKRNCNKCYSRGYTGINTINNTISAICSCADRAKIFSEWKEYVQLFPELVEMYKEEEEENEG